MKKIIQIVKPLVLKFPIIAMAYRNWRDGKDMLRDPKISTLGFKFIGNEAMENGVFEPYETKLVKK